MKTIKNLLVASIIIATMSAFTANSIDDFFNISIMSIDKEEINMNSFKGKKILIVNVASACGYTRQYKDLQKLHETYGDKLVVLGVPCNQFGGQESGSLKEIKEFCSTEFQVTFPMTEKIKVKGEGQHPLYQWLTSKNKNGKMDATVGWNFHKFLIDEKGNLIESFTSGVKPMDEAITKYL